MSRIALIKRFCDEMVEHEAEKLGIRSTCHECQQEDFEYFKEQVASLDLLLTSAEDWVRRANGVVALFKGAESIGERGIKLLEEVADFEKRGVADE